VAPLSSVFAKKFKTHFRILCRSFYDSRNRWRELASQKSLEIERIKAERDSARQEGLALQIRLAECESQIQSQQHPQPNWQTLSIRRGSVGHGECVCGRRFGGVFLTEDAQRSIVAQFSKLMASIEEMRVFQNNVIEGFRLGRDCREAVTLHQH